MLNTTMKRVSILYSKGLFFLIRILFYLDSFLEKILEPNNKFLESALLTEHG